jgi:hypothetical protein
MQVDIKLQSPTIHPAQEHRELAASLESRKEWPTCKWALGQQASRLVLLGRQS